MSSLATELLSRAAGFLAASYAEAGLWVVSARGRIVGSLADTEEGWRLSWFEGADIRLVNYAGRIDGDIEALSQALTLRLGAPVRLDPLPS
jgi:hypothetical protein